MSATFLHFKAATTGTMRAPNLSNECNSRFGWTGNMQKIIQSQTHSKTQDMQRDYYLNQKKTLEINPRHPLIKELLRRVEDNPADATAKEMAVMMFNTATLR